MVTARNLDFDSKPFDDEPYSDEPELESSLHLAQIILLLTCLEWWWQDRQDFFAAGNLSIYYQPIEFHSRKFRGPDFFVVLGTNRRPRRSWVVSKEGDRYPNLIIEILSNKTAKNDRTTKKNLYQNLFKTPEYFWFDPDVERLEFKGFRLESGEYQEISPTAQGWLWSEQLGLYLGIHNEKLRYFTPDGTLIPNFEEETQRQEQVITAVQERLQQTQIWAETERQRAETERQRAEQAEASILEEQQKNERLMDYLRSQGIEPPPFP
jgi:Uma2 family endonuclease